MTMECAVSGAVSFVVLSLGFPEPRLKTPNEIAPFLFQEVKTMSKGYEWRKMMFRLLIATAFAALFSEVSFAAPQKKANPHALEGTLEDGELVLEDKKDPYIVTGEYVVPVGAKLIIKEGVTLLFNKGSGLLAQGELAVEGVTNAPVVFKGKSSGIAYWEGIKIEKSDSSDISCAIIQGAKDAVTFSRL